MATNGTTKKRSPPTSPGTASPPVLSPRPQTSSLRVAATNARARASFLPAPSTNRLQPIANPMLWNNTPMPTPSPQPDEARLRATVMAKPGALQDTDLGFPASPQPTFSVEDRRIARDYLERRNEIGPKLVIFMVGLPARGKSYISHKLRRFLSWMGFRTKIFNVGNRRRVADAGFQADGHRANGNHVEAELHPVGDPHHHDTGATTHDATFFDPNNARARELREQVALDTLEELISWLKSGGKVAIHDATNSTRVRREALIHRVAQEPNISFMFMESICTDPIILETNIRMKLNSPDYRNMDPEAAIADFKARTHNYEKAYEPLGDVEEELDVSYVKVFNVGKKSIAYNVRGYLMSQCVFFLGNMHIADRVIYLTRHGESEYNREGKIGGDPPLTEQGRQFAAALARFAQERHPIAPACPEKSKADSTFGGGGGGQLQLWTSKLRRTVETAQYFDEQYEVTTMRFLNEIYSGLCEGMTYDDIEKVYPEEYRTRQANKLIGRYPGGENYMDVIERLRPVVVELERLSTDVLIITHNVVMRTLLAYFTGMDLLEMTLLDVPLHTVYCLKPKPYGVEIVKYRWNRETDGFDEVTEQPRDEPKYHS